MGRVDATVRFWKYVKKLDGENACWVWTGGFTNKYGHIWNPIGPQRAHRLSYEMRNGPIPDGMTIDHLCGRPACVRPEHLEAVSLAENLARRKFVNPQPKVKNCVICDAEFTPHHTKRRRKLTCSTECANKARSIAAKARGKKAEE